MYTDLGASGTELARSERMLAEARNHVAELHPLAPISGIVVTPHVRDVQGRYVAEGALLMEIADMSTLRARLYVPEYEMRDVKLHEPVALRFQSFWQSVRGKVDSISVAPAEIPPGLISESRYKGLKPPSFYVVDIRVPNQGDLRIGMSGEAKLYVRRQSLLNKGWETVRDFVARRAW